MRSGGSIGGKLKVPAPSLSNYLIPTCSFQARFHLKKYISIKDPALTLWNACSRRYHSFEGSDLDRAGIRFVRAVFSHRKPHIERVTGGVKLK